MTEHRQATTAQRRRRGVAAGAVLALILSVVASLVGLRPADAATPRAFPGAEGYGTDTPGGRGGVVCQVTNLADSGPGSLRACVNASGPRYVIFRTGGTIELNTRLDIANPYITIAGQTAPGDGITLRMKPGTGTDQGTMKIDTHDVVIRYLRFRPGDGGAADDSHDSIAAYKEGGGSYNIVLDHNSFSWAVDEVVNVYYDVDSYTISNNIISEALSNAGHPEGEHSKGMLIGGGSTNASVHHNLFAHNMDRSPQVSGVVNADLRNNLIYNYGDGSGSGVTLVSSSKGEPVVNWVGNYYKPGPDSDPARAEFATYVGGTGATHQWFDGGDNLRWTAAGDAPARLGDTHGTELSAEAPMAPVTTTSAAQAYADVLADAGASKVRDAVDDRVVADVENGTGSIIDAPSEVGGWPVLNEGTAPTDTDGDGVPDSFEASHGSDPAVADATGDADGNGYMTVEDWANGLVGDAATDPGPTPEPSPSPTPTDSPTPTPEPTPTDSPTPTPTPEPTPTDSPTPTPTPEPTPEPVAVEVWLNGPMRCPVVEAPQPGDTVVCTYQ